MEFIACVVSSSSLHARDSAVMLMRAIMIIIVITTMVTGGGVSMWVRENWGWQEWQPIMHFVQYCIIGIFTSIHFSIL